MKIPLDGLLIDLHNRCDLIRGRLRTLVTDDNHPANSLALLIYRTATQTREAVERLLADPDLHEPALAKNYLATYTRLAEEFHLAERKGLPVLERFNDDDRRLTALVHRLASEHGMEYAEHLVVTASSSDYYWTLPILGLISVPATEARTLLGLADLHHEIGHTLVAIDRTAVGQVELAAALHFSTHIVDAEGRGDPQADKYRISGHLWQSGWAIEFVCDAIATYLVGPAFGYQHIRLAAEQTADPWRPTLGELSTHPADAPRARVAVEVMKLIGLMDEAREVHAAWEDHVDRIGRPRAGLHDACYPPDLLQLAARTAVDFLRGNGIADAGQVGADPGSACALLNHAWRRFLGEPRTYPEWERQNLPT